MTTKNKKIETRLEPETRAEFERLADDLGVSPYTAVQWAIDCFIDKYKRPKDVPMKFRGVSGIIPDDYYQKTINISFIRIIRLLAFFIAIFIPAYYIAITTHNHDSVTTSLLLNFLAQRESVPFPALVEGIIMTVSFEILRESDMRMASTMGTAVSILGGLVLGDAAVQAGIISPIMIIVVAISAISGLAFTSIELTSAIRFWRIFLMILAASLGIYGIYLGLILLITKLASISSFSKPYLAPFSPFIKSEQTDAILKINTNNKLKKRNPLLTKNKIRGR